jgi:3-hydroxyacyl-[acyl-carrier-protein] dehydratase
MGVASEEVLKGIPQRPPFLFVDEVIEASDKSIVTCWQATGSEDFFKGHFPGNPIMPGVLLQEAAFQSGALLMGRQGGSGLGVVARVENVKFKDFVKPGDLLKMEITLDDTVGNAFYFSGKTKVGDKTVMQIKFTGALV